MAEKLTKKEAVRRALAELGNTAMPVAIQGWLKNNLGVEMTAGHISTTKGELLRKAAAMPAAEPAAPASPASSPASEPAGNALEGSITKFEAVRRALDALGKKAKPADIQTFIKDNFNLEITLGHAKTNKGKILRAAGKKKSSKKAAPAKAAAAPAPPAAPAIATIVVVPAPSKGFYLEDILKLRELVARVGPENLLSLIDVLA